MLYCEIFCDVVAILLARNLLFCSTLPLSKLAYPSFLCESYSDPSQRSRGTSSCWKPSI